MASHDEETMSYMMYMKSLLWHPSHNVRTSTTTLPVEAVIPYPHLPFSAHLVIQRELRIVILLWIPCILALITGRESAMPSCAYPGFPGILFLWIPVPPASFHFSYIRFTT